MPHYDLCSDLDFPLLWDKDLGLLGGPAQGICEVSVEHLVETRTGSVQRNVTMPRGQGSDKEEVPVAQAGKVQRQM